MAAFGDVTVVTPPHAAERRRRRNFADAAAAEKTDRRAAAADQNHPARRRRQNAVGAGLYFQLVSRQQARHLHVSSRWLCTGAVPATHNTWFKKRAIHFAVRGTHILLAEQPGCGEGVHDSWLQRSHCCQPLQ